MNAPTIVISIVAPLNALLNWALVWGPEPIRLGFIGAPLATAIGFNTAWVTHMGETASVWVLH
jgi:Na+-driven multidrug efflux pump